MPHDIDADADCALYSYSGTVDPTTLKVTLSPALAITENNSTSMAIAAISATKYVIIYHHEGNVKGAVRDGVFATVVSGSEVLPGVNKAELVSASKSTFTGYSISGTFKATTLTNTKTASGLSEVIIAYIDVKTRMGLTCTSLLVNPVTGTVIDGSSLSITTGASVAAYSSVSIVTIGTGSKFMVSFTNRVLQGSLMAAIGQVGINMSDFFVPFHSSSSVLAYLI